MPAGDSVRMAWAISGRAHKAWMVSCRCRRVLGLPGAYSLPMAINSPAQLEFSRHWGRPGVRPYRAAKSSFRSMKRPKTCWKSFIYLWVAEAGFWR